MSIESLPETTSFTAKVLEKGKSLKIVAKWGIGIDAIDLKAAQRLGIPVKNTRDVFADEVGDVALGYIILLAGQLHKMDLSVRGGGWQQIPGMTLGGKTLGLSGWGVLAEVLFVVYEICMIKSIWRILVSNG